jgi:Resolvase, N terminal domain
MVELRTHSTASAAVPGVVLCVADGIVRVVVRASDNSRGRSRREINLLIPVTASEEKRCDHDRDAPVRRSFGHHALRSQRWRSPLNSAGLTLIRNAASRSIADLASIVRELEAKGVALKAVQQPIDTSTSAGRAFVQMLGVFAEFETAIRKERQLEGIAAAKARGVYK